MEDRLLIAWLAAVMGPRSAAVEQLTASTEAAPGRVSRAFADLLCGYAIQPEAVIKGTRMLADDERAATVEVRNIDFISMCPHHFLPYFGVARIEYEPRAMIVGIGKLPRLVFALSRRLQIQEDLTREIATTLHAAGGASRVTVEMRARHLCMCYRGPDAVAAETTTSFTSE